MYSVSIASRAISTVHLSEYITCLHMCVYVCVCIYVYIYIHTPQFNHILYHKVQAAVARKSGLVAATFWYRPHSSAFVASVVSGIWSQSFRRVCRIRTFRSQVYLLRSFPKAAGSLARDNAQYSIVQYSIVQYSIVYSNSNSNSNNNSDSNSVIVSDDRERAVDMRRLAR